MIKSITMIAPSAVLTEADDLCAALGWGSGNFLVPLAESQSGPPTHYGMRASVTDNLVDGLADAIGQSPSLSGAVIVDVRPDGERLGHFDEVVSVAGLVRVDLEGGV